MSQNINISAFFNDFAATFPSDKKVEQAIFIQNINQLFTNNLLDIAAQCADSPTEIIDGNLAFWQPNESEIACGVLMKNVSKLLRIDTIPTEIALPVGLTNTLNPKQFLSHNTDILKNIAEITQGLYIPPGRVDGAAKVHQSEMFAILQQITRDSLAIEPLYGKVSIQAENAVTTNRPNGTNLVRSLIKGFTGRKPNSPWAVYDKRCCTINFSHPIKGSTTNIELDGDINAYTYPEDDTLAGSGAGTSARIYIRKSYRGGEPQVLAHELVHAMRIMLGRRVAGTGAGKTNQEEVEGITAENVLALEMGKPLRSLPAGQSSQDITFWTDFQYL